MFYSIHLKTKQFLVFLLSCFLVCTLLLGAFPATSFAQAEDNNAAKQEEGYSPEFPKVKIDDVFMKDLLSLFPMGDFAKWAISFTLPRIFPNLFPDDSKEDPTIQKLDEIMCQLEQVQTMMSGLEGIIVNTHDKECFKNILNNTIFPCTNNNQFVKETVRGLASIEDKYGTLKDPKKELNKQEAKAIDAERTEMLLSGLGMKDNPSFNQYKIDEQENAMYNLLTNKFYVSVNGVETRLNISQIFAEYARFNPSFIWEHEAEEYLDALNYNLLTNYLIVNSIDYLSALARVRACNGKDDYFVKQRAETCLANYNEMKACVDRAYTDTQGGFQVTYNKNNPVRHLWSRANGANCDFYIQYSLIESGTCTQPFLTDFDQPGPGSSTQHCKTLTANSNMFVQNESFSGTNFGDKKSSSWSKTDKQQGITDMTTPNKTNDPNEFWSHNLYKKQIGELLDSSDLAEILKAASDKTNILEILYRAYGGDNAVYNDPQHKEKSEFSYQLEFFYNQVKKDSKEWEKMRMILPYNDPNGFGFAVDHTGSTHIKFSTEWTDWVQYDGETTLSCYSLPLNANKTFISGANGLPKLDKTGLIKANAQQVKLSHNGYIESQQSVLSCLYDPNNAQYYLFKTLLPEN